MLLNLKKYYHKLFEIGLIIKLIDGISNIIGAIFLYFINSDKLVSIFEKIFSHEIIQDPQDFLANFLINFLINFFTNITISTKYFLIIYLLIHGIVKILIVKGLWNKKKSSYIFASILFSIILLLEIYKIINEFSYFLMFLIIVDIITLSLIKIEYIRLKQTLYK